MWLFLLLLGSTEDVLLMEEENRDFTGSELMQGWTCETSVLSHPSLETVLEFFEQNENDSDSSSTTGSTQPELEAS